jgi:aldehyde dehydrogenase (NAD+)
MNYINGEFSKRNDFASINPSTEAEIQSFPQSTQTEVNHAVACAKTAAPGWRSLSRIARGEYFEKLCGLIKENVNSVADEISRETGKTINESKAEVIEALHMAQYTFGMARMPHGECVSSEIAAKDCYSFRKPKGTVAVVSPWNFPYAIMGFWCAAPALLEGNTVVCKPAEDTPYIGELTAHLYHKAGFPKGVFNVLQGDGKVGDMLVRHNDINHICFTGSAEVGQHIRKVCADTWHKTCSCEMGSKSAVIVFDDADMELALNACIASAFKLSGQRCVSSGRMLIQRKAYGNFCEKFAALAKRVKVGDPFESNDVFMGPLINESQLAKVLKFNELASKSDGVNVLVNGGRVERKGYFLTPFVYQSEWGEKKFLKNEVFGPHVALVPFDDLDDAIRIYNDTEYGLALGVITNDFKKARECRERCDYGLGYWNGGSIAAESHLNFGGVKKSGLGGSSAAGTFRTVTNEVTWTVNHGPLAFPQGLK